MDKKLEVLNFIISELFGYPEMNILEYKFDHESGTVLIKLEDVTDGTIYIHELMLEYRGMASTPNKGDFSTYEH